MRNPFIFEPEAFGLQEMFEAEGEGEVRRRRASPSRRRPARPRRPRPRGPVRGWPLVIPYPWPAPPEPSPSAGGDNAPSAGIEAAPPTCPCPCPAPPMATPAEPPAADAPGEFWAGEDEIFELADEYESGSGLEYNRWVQTALNRVMGLHLAVDGIVGPKTRSAIRSFQQKQGLRVDGIVGPITESALIRAAGLPPGAVASPSPYVPAPAIPGGGAKPTGSPVAGGRVTSPFGYRTHPLSGERKLHQGIDIGGLPVGTQVNATAGGQVVFAGNSGCAGNMVKIAHGNGYLTKYFHLNSISVSAGQTVSRGQKVGGLGQTGCVTGPHLHYEVHRNGVATDPAPFINP